MLGLVIVPKSSIKKILFGKETGNEIHGNKI